METWCEQSWSLDTIGEAPDQLCTNRHNNRIKQLLSEQQSEHRSADRNRLWIWFIRNRLLAAAALHFWPTASRTEPGPHGPHTHTHTHTHSLWVLGSDWRCVVNCTEGETSLYRLNGGRRRKPCLESWPTDCLGKSSWNWTFRTRTWNKLESSKFKYLLSCWRDCDEMWFRRSCSPQDEL